MQGTHTHTHITLTLNTVVSLSCSYLLCAHVIVSDCGRVAERCFRQHRTTTVQSVLEALIHRPGRCCRFLLFPHDSSSPTNATSFSKLFVLVRAVSVTKRSRLRHSILHPMSTLAVAPFVVVSLDFVGPLVPASDTENDFLLVCVDVFTKIAHLIPLRFAP